jgi:hypothetical protein
MTDNKGEEIRFVAGNYIGETGWLNAAKRHTKLKYYVIVDLDDEEKATLVWKTSVKLSSEEVAPTSFEEACLRQHPDIDAAFDQITKLLAACGVGRDSDEIPRIMSKKLLEACVARDVKGNKASSKDQIPCYLQSVPSQLRHSW